METAFKPIKRIEGYLPIEDHGLIGDCTTAAPVGRDGVISWMCIPRFDSAAPTSSLPEAIGGPRNWGYRYA
jgi:GH15 family glucan-1,4-alpha-glucosidase